MIKTALESNMSKIFFTILICIAYLVVIYFFVSIIRFLGTEVGDVWEKDTITTMQLYNSPYCLPFKIGGIIGIILYVFRDKLTNR